MEFRFDEGGGLGSYGVYMTPTEVNGYPAYKVGDVGWESYCPTTGYIVDLRLPGA